MSRLLALALLLLLGKRYPCHGQIEDSILALESR